MTKRRKSGKRTSTAKHRAGGHRKTRTRRSRSLSGFGAVTSAVSGTMQQLTGPLAVAGGFIAGSFIAKQLGKIKAIKEAEAGGLVANYAKAGILVAAGAAAAHFGKNMPIVKNMGVGLAVSGIVAGVNKALPKQELTADLLSGDDEIGVYSETSEEVQRLLGASQFTADLPMLTESVSGAGNTFQSEMNTKDVDYSLLG